MTISNINQGNKALEFVESRIKDEKYRGSRSSQHNRYIMQQVVDILRLFDQYAPNQKLMPIRTTDISKRPQNTAEEATYAQFCNDAKEKTKGITSKKGIGTQDAMRKNLFPDLHRMGLIVRYGKDKRSTDPFAKQSVKYVSISDQGLKLINAKTILDKYFIFSKAIDSLLGGYIDLILDILRDKEYEMDNLNIFEYMFFVSAIGTESSFNINTDNAVELIKEYRNLTPTQRQSVIETLKVELNPKKFQGTKTNKRDFHNWHNKAVQVFYLLNQTVYFEVRGEKLILREGKNSFNEKETINTRLDRSLNEKYQYFVRNDVGKISGFELHHVVPLAWSESTHHFKLLDKWENMVYIDAFNHAKITQNKNRNVIMDFINDDMTLTDHSKHQIYLKVQENIAYKPTNKTTMKKYNNELLNTITD
ncbi:MAG: Type-2 restriction enzyme MboII [Parcubacteria group bacterium GW2011_GWA2_42_28]|nr:MAG: Type-2 restriction enzyme MboII [Parcubacteria group bacterium GW2011_GWA2_42_28]